MELLSLISRRGSDVTRVHLGREIPSVVNVLQRSVFLPEAAEWITTMLAHCVETAFTPVDPDKTLVRSLFTTDVLNTAVTVFDKPGASLETVLHALSILTLACNYTSENSMRVERILSLFAALTRSRDIGLRVVALVFFRTVDSERMDDSPQPDPSPNQLELSLAAFPPDLRKVLVDYDFERCTLSLLQKETHAFRSAVADLNRDHDLLKFAEKLAPILQNGHAVLDDRIVTLPEHETLSSVDWVEALPVCVELLRRRASPGDSEVAIALELEYSRMTQPDDTVLADIRKAIAQHPQHPNAYALYCISDARNYEDTADIAKLGLQCPDILPALRWQLLSAAAINLSHKARALILGADNTDDARRAYGIACAKQAMDYGRMYLEETPPDSCDRLDVLEDYYFNILLLHGHEIDKHSTLLKVGRERFCITIRS